MKYNCVYYCDTLCGSRQHKQVGTWVHRDTQTRIIRNIIAYVICHMSYASINSTAFTTTTTTTTTTIYYYYYYYLYRRLATDTDDTTTEEEGQSGGSLSVNDAVTDISKV
jgi:hypothetical protein